MTQECHTASALTMLGDEPGTDYRLRQCFIRICHRGHTSWHVCLLGREGEGGGGFFLTLNRHPEGVSQGKFVFQPIYKPQENFDGPDVAHGIRLSCAVFRWD